MTYILPHRFRMCRSTLKSVGKAQFVRRKLNHCVGTSFSSAQCDQVSTFLHRSSQYHKSFNARVQDDVSDKSVHNLAVGPHWKRMFLCLGYQISSNLSDSWDLWGFRDTERKIGVICGMLGHVTTITVLHYYWTYITWLVMGQSMNHIIRTKPEGRDPKGL